MLTKLRIQNFKGFDDVEIPLGQMTVFVGPNNSGKTTALQALTLWYAGYLSWDGTVAPLIDRRLSGGDRPHFDERPASIARHDLISIPVPRASLLWHSTRHTNGETRSITITVSGKKGGEMWDEGLAFTFVNEDSVGIESHGAGLVYIDSLVPAIRFLTPMSGLASVESLIQPGRINVLIGEGQTAQVLHNLCYELYEKNDGTWVNVVEKVRAQFGLTLLDPIYDSGRGETRLAYRDRAGIMLDLASAGRGMLQMLLLLAYLYRNPGAVLLLDEPDAHLEILRQREMYTLLVDIAHELDTQIIMTTHSEVILEAALMQKDTVIAFTGQPHRLSRSADFVKSLSLIPAEDYYLADQIGWVLYCEGTSDYPLLEAFAARLSHPVLPYLQRTFNKDIAGNKPSVAKDHFTGLREAYPDLYGVALFDRVSAAKLKDTPPGLRLLSWRRREIENYLLTSDTLLNFARLYRLRDLLPADEANRRAAIMQESIDAIAEALTTLNRPAIESENVKASDEVLTPLFKRYFNALGIPNLMRKADYHLLVPFIPDDQIDPEITEKLDAILAVARQAQPTQD
ncbi:MAG: AAA family ATPase [Chloroflexota bacterium]|nr:AAA family ATPase [Chloroflexota bacterium]